MKRVFDLTVGAVLAVAAMPLIVVLAAATAVSLRCWPFFVHRRVGHRGRAFSLVKLRTLPLAAPLWLWGSKWVHRDRTLALAAETDPRSGR
ncbi:MAG: sugar transferase [Acidimicrobiales bacterium]